MAETSTAAPARSPSRRAFWIGVVVGVVVTAGIFAAVIAFRTSTAAGSIFLFRNAHADGVVETASGLQYKVLKPGLGAKPTDKDVTLINYEGKLLDGTTFDKSQQPTPMAVAGVVNGFSEALKLMPKGAKYRIWLKPSLGYGDKATGPIPPNSVLVFDIELIDFLPEATIRQMQAAQMGRGAAPAR